MAVDPNEARRQRVLDALADGASRTWTRTVGANTFAFTVANPQMGTLNGVRVLTVEVTVTRNGVTIYDDRVNMPNPAVAVRNAGGNPVDNPLQALRDQLFDTVSAVLRGGGAGATRLQRNPDGSFKGDTLSVRAGTTDGSVVSGPSVAFSTMAVGTGLVANTTNTSDPVVWWISGGAYSGEMLFFEYDTSSIGASPTITGAVYTFYGNTTAESNANTYDLEARYKDWGGTVTTADWFDPRAGVWNALVSGGALAVGSWDQTAGNANNLSDSGVYTSIAKTGTTRIVLGFSGMSSATPTGLNRIVTRMADQAGTSSDPLLTVTYTTTVNATINSVVATAAGAGKNPVATVAPTSLKATAAAAGTTPGTNLATTSLVATATASAKNPVPNVIVPVVASTATGAATSPVVTGTGTVNATITSTVSTASTDAKSPVPTIAPTSTAATATAAATSPGLSVAEGSVVATVSASAAAPAPTVALPATASSASTAATSPTPVVAPTATAATASATATSPGTSLSQPSTVATATTTATSPVPTIKVSPSAASATAQANAPGASLTQPTPAATASTLARTPVPTLKMAAPAATATVTAASPVIRIVAWARLVVSIAKNFRVAIDVARQFAADIAVTRAPTVATSIQQTHSVAITVAHNYEVEIIMSNTTCYVGNSIVATGTFRNAAGTAVDPTTITATVEAPGGVATAYVYLTAGEMAKTSTGIYTCTFTPNAPGDWIVKFAGTGNAIAVNQETFKVLTAI